MNDAPSQPETPLQVARTGMYDAMVALEKTLYNLGYDHGFNAGWEAAVRRFTAMMEQKPEPVEAPAPQLPPSLERTEHEASAKDVVLGIVRQAPGLRGVEIVDAAAKAGAPLNERTVRTALHRLKIAGQIRVEDGKWFVADVAACATA